MGISAMQETHTGAPCCTPQDLLSAAYETRRIAHCILYCVVLQPDVLVMATASQVLQTCRRVCSQAKHVTINHDAIQKAAAGMSDADLARISTPASFDTTLHYVDRSNVEGIARTIQYLLVVDALNFCFWPHEGLEYEQLSKGLKAALEKDSQALSAARLAAMTLEGVQQLVGCELPLQEERARLLREIGDGLLKHYNGSAAQLVRAAGGSALALVDLVTATFPGFRDHAVCQGQQVFFYKRAQIFVGDVYGALLGQGLGEFTDMDQITMFADYRVPVVLKVMGILQYDAQLEQQVASCQQLQPGSPEEIEIRAATVVAVDLLRSQLQARLPSGSAPLLSVTLDWWLWELGEKNKEQHPPFHRTLTVFY